MDEAISLAGLSGLMKQAIKLIKGVEVKQEDEKFSFGLFSMISWFKVCSALVLSCQLAIRVTIALPASKGDIMTDG